jgi:hypothetical protein
MPIYHRERFFAWIDTETTGLAHDDVPIEVAMIITNEKLEEQVRFVSFINLYTPREFLVPDGELWKWDVQAQPAAEVHRIDPEELKESINQPHLVALRMTGVLECFTRQHKGKLNRPIMVSDNPVFDWRMLKKIFTRQHVSTWPFHYSTWSAIMLHAALSVPYPKSEDKEHRALSGIEGLLDRTRKVLGILEETFVKISGKGVLEVYSAKEIIVDDPEFGFGELSKKDRSKHLKRFDENVPQKARTAGKLISERLTEDEFPLAYGEVQSPPAAELREEMRAARKGRRQSFEKRTGNNSAVRETPLLEDQ